MSHRCRCRTGPRVIESNCLPRRRADAADAAGADRSPEPRGSLTRMRHPVVRPAIAVLFVSLLVVLSGCAQAPERRGGRVPVTVAVAATRSVPYELDATGTVEPIASADVLPQGGGMVTRIGFREGDDVRAGQVLVELDKTVFETEFARTAA